MKKLLLLISITSALLCSCDSESAGSKAAKQKVEALMREMEAIDTLEGRGYIASLDAFVTELHALNGAHIGGGHEDSEETNHDSLLKAPTFPGGAEALFRYLQNGSGASEITAPKHKAVVAFTVNAEGQIGEVEFIQSTGDEFTDSEIKKMIEGMPAWSPGLRRGKPVSVRYFVPIHP